jgi:hypothetical protein
MIIELLMSETLMRSAIQVNENDGNCLEKKDWLLRASTANAPYSGVAISLFTLILFIQQLLATALYKQEKSASLDEYRKVFKNCNRLQFFF